MNIASLLHLQPRTLAFAIPLTALIAAAALVMTSSRELPATSLPGSYPELQELSRQGQSFAELAAFFKAVAEAKGAAYAFGLLRVAPLAPNTDLHLLAHHVGDVLYRQRGLDGIQICTDEFRNACSHTIVVGLFYERGISALPDIAQACRAAPGGSGAYTMCFHGLGHGILAYTGYDLPEAIRICSRTATPQYAGREEAECVGGAIMEIISGGGHDKDLWSRQAPKYFQTSDPLYPCTADFMPQGAPRLRCYSYLTPHLFRAAGADLAAPQPRDYAAAFRFCERISPSNAQARGACFGGFGKEFTVLAKDRDIRRIEDMTDAELKRVYEWCMLAEDRGGTAACIEQAMQSLYWGGENDRNAAIRFCMIINDQAYRDGCMGDLIGAVGFYIRDRNYHEAFCAELSADYRRRCRDRLLP